MSANGMTAREANEILKLHEINGHFSDIDHDGYAKGYLKAVEKFAPVVESLDKHHDQITLGPVYDMVVRHAKDCEVCVILKNYHRDVLGLEN